MFRKSGYQICLIAVLGLTLAGLIQAAPVGTGLTYQGWLTDANKPADGLYDLQFRLYDANTAGIQKGIAIDVNDLHVIDGHLKVVLDFGSGIFEGNARWLEIAVRPGDVNDPNVYAVLSPRQEITPTPYAIFAQNAGKLGGLDSGYYAHSAHSHHSLDSADGSPIRVVYVDNAGNVGIGTTTPAHELDVSGTVSGTNSGSDGMGVYGHATYTGSLADLATNYGGYFQADGIEGIGVYGHAPYTQMATGNQSEQKTNYGGYFQADGLKGIGVYGRATVNVGYNVNYGGYFQADGAYGTGVYAEATVGDGYGVKGVCDKHSGKGGYFQANGMSGVGVIGRGSRYGGQFDATDESGTGVDAFGSRYGVYSSSSSGIAGYFSSGTGYGLIVEKGNVGIGMTSPGVKLDVAGGEMRISNPGDGNVLLNLSSERSWAFRQLGTGLETALELASVGGGGNKNFIINTTGYVGIGTTSPTDILELSSPSPKLYFNRESSTSNVSGLYWRSTGDSFEGAFVRNNSSGNIELYTNVTGGTPRMLITDAGNVGIGTIGPAFLLHVNGSAGKPGGGSWSNASDARLKKDVSPLDRALDQLLQLHGVTFEYKEPQQINELPGEQIGMVAQQVEQVFPQWVDENADGYKTVTYRGFEALTVEAFRQLREEKDAEIRALKAENDALKQRLEALERKMEQFQFAVAKEAQQ